MRLKTYVLLFENVCENMCIKVHVMLFKNWKLLFEMVYQITPYILPKKIREFPNKNIYNVV